MVGGFPVWVVITDYLLGVVMWTLIGRFAMGIFLPEDSTFFFMKDIFAGRQYFLLHEGLRQDDQSRHQGICNSNAELSGSAVDSDLRGLVFLHGAFLCNALVTRLLGNGHVIFPAGKRVCTRYCENGQLVRQLEP